MENKMVEGQEAFQLPTADSAQPILQCLTGQREEMLKIIRQVQQLETTEEQLCLRLDRFLKELIQDEVIQMLFKKEGARGLLCRRRPELKIKGLSFLALGCLIPAVAARLWSSLDQRYSNGLNPADGWLFAGAFAWILIVTVGLVFFCVGGPCLMRWWNGIRVTKDGVFVDCPASLPSATSSTVALPTAGTVEAEVEYVVRLEWECAIKPISAFPLQERIKLLEETIQAITQAAIAFTVKAEVHSLALQQRIEELQHVCEVLSRLGQR